MTDWLTSKWSKTEQLVDRVGVHGADRVEREAVLAHRLGRGRHVALADVQRGGDVGLARPSLGEHHENLLILGHRYAQSPFPLRHPELDARHGILCSPRAVPGPFTRGIGSVDWRYQ